MASEITPDVEFWRLKKVVDKTGLSKSEIYRRAAESRFPKSKPYQEADGTPSKARFWISTDVLDWMKAQVPADDLSSMLG